MPHEEIDGRIGLFDLDGTLANYEQGMRYWLNKMRSPDEPMYDVHTTEPAYFYERQKVIRRQPGFWLKLERVQLGFDVLAAALEVGFTNIHACTRGPIDCPAAWGEKYQWVQEQKASGALPQDMKITITEDKGTVYGRFLCDDYLHYLQRWLQHRKRGLGILIAPTEKVRPAIDDPRIVCYDGANLPEIKDWLKRAFEREAGSLL